MTGSAPHYHRITLVSFAAVLIAAWFCYQPAFTGGFQLDDVSNLADIEHIETGGDMLDFILEGEAGPGGRPIALWTFALQADHWEQGAAPFLKVNVLIHLVNAALLAWCLYQLAIASSVDRRKAGIVAAAAAGLWVVMPLLATSSLAVVQRMTTLSAFFCLLGLAGYLTARAVMPASPQRALAGMSASVVTATLLATLSKESGLLLPVYILVLESTVLRRPENLDAKRWQIWKAVFLVLPLAVVMAYLVSRASYPDWIIARRDFNAWERVITEARILWSYVFKGVVGFTGQLGLTQAPPAVSRSIFEPLTLIAAVSWLALAAGAVVWRRRFPLAALAVLWFLAGHLIESTTVPLELYFEHRNYLPVVGPLFALSAWLLMSGLAKAGAIALAGYFLVNTLLLYGLTSLWGQPSLAANYWALHHPDSVRAATELASRELVDWGPTTARKVLNEFVTANPEHGYLRMQILNLDCLTNPAGDHSAMVAALDKELARVDFTYTAGTMLSQLSTTVARNVCNGVNTTLVKRLADALRANPRYAGDPLYNQFHHKLLANIARMEGDLGETVAHLQAAISHRPSTELNMMMVTTLAGAENYAAARTFIDEALDKAPRYPLRAVAWRRNLLNLREYVAELERYSRGAQQIPNEDS